MRLSLTALAATALLAVAACSGSTATTAPTAAPTAAATPAASVAAPSTAPTAAPTATASSAAPSASSAPSGAAAGPTVTILNFAFNPATVTAKVGDKVKWMNNDDAPHTVSFDDASITSSGTLNNAQSFETTFAKAGSYTYHCKIHPSMKATVTVS